MCRVKDEARSKLADIQKAEKDSFVIALAGNPNVGKSTLFNALTGLNQHTGNWAGKTVSCAYGKFRWLGKQFILVDLPGAYSLRVRCAEEALTRDFICFDEPDAVAVVVDGSCLERNLLLLLQVMEVAKRVVLCVNLQDEAKANGIIVDLIELEKVLGLSVVGTSAKHNEGLYELKNVLYRMCTESAGRQMRQIQYSPEIEYAIAKLKPYVVRALGDAVDARWFALRLLEGDHACVERVRTRLEQSLAREEKFHA